MLPVFPRGQWNPDFRNINLKSYCIKCSGPSSALLPSEPFVKGRKLEAKARAKRSLPGSMTVAWWDWGGSGSVPDLTGTSRVGETESVGGSALLGRLHWALKNEKETPWFDSLNLTSSFPTPCYGGFIACLHPCKCEFVKDKDWVFCFLFSVLGLWARNSHVC